VRAPSTACALPCRPAMDSSIRKTHHANTKAVGLKATCPKTEQPRGSRHLLDLPAALPRYPAPLCLLNYPSNTPKKNPTHTSPTAAAAAMHPHPAWSVSGKDTQRAVSSTAMSRALVAPQAYAVKPPSLRRTCVCLQVSVSVCVCLCVLGWGKNCRK